MKLSLTFDNGPDLLATPVVLDELAKRNLPATFFPVGERLDGPGGLELIHKLVSGGHQVGNHTYSHPRPLGALTAVDAVAEIEKTDALLGDLRGPDRFFRPSAEGGVIGPGVLNEAVVDHLCANGHTMVMWNVVCEDWVRHDGSWVPLAHQRIANIDWAVLVLHDIDEEAMSHLGGFLDDVLESGREVVPSFPPELVPISRGVVQQPLDHLI